ncbi:PilZ domain-containing protein [Novosphingobium album (ex Liu et al. 2023)]|uniref:PilZ domain-containing protein n=1 Tax=Novosphingobium album (ex Liu et al. 2023) TaxID=3031130 RepID=A0ABT5WPY3_9SPHN|nr:PilZ domain-containing protein [Novosphingobium album (ex Liu et al. 2023)]MDE8652066.1 PilZ domain-containing protein [Novosphingobium album (ex Liu et al. 2023)]
MDAPLERLSGANSVNRRNRRREPRKAARFEATLESSGGSRTKVVLADVSRHGCSIRSQSPWLHQGAFVSIWLRDAPRLSAIVRWVRDGTAGMEFLRPIPSERTEWIALIDADF